MPNRLNFPGYTVLSDPVTDAIHATYDELPDTCPECGVIDRLHRWGKRDKTNNRISNLRPCSVSQNQANTGLPITNTSGSKGVCWHKANKRWVAAIRTGGRRVNLGSFEDKEAAVAAYEQASRAHFGEFSHCPVELGG